MDYLVWAKGHVPLEVGAPSEQEAVRLYASRYGIPFGRVVGVVEMSSLRFYEINARRVDR